MTPATLQATRPRQALTLLGGTTLLGVVTSYLYVLALGGDDTRSETTAAAVVLFVTALSCFAFGVLAGLLTRRLTPMLMGYLPGLVVVLLTGLQIADVPRQDALVLLDVLRDAWVLVNPLLWLPFVAVALALRGWQPTTEASPPAPLPARTSGGSPTSTRSRTEP